MKRKNKISDELKDISPLLASMEKTNIFSAPENYFDNLAEKITVYSFLNQDNKAQAENINHLPPGYFDTLSDQIFSKIKSQESEESTDEFEKDFPALYSLKNKNVFSVPPDYFENLSEKIVSKTQRPATKIISITKAKSWWRIAAAAVITSAIAISSLQIFNNSPDMKKNNSVITESGGLPDYIQSSFQYKTPQQVDEGIASLSDDEIVKYLENHGNIMDNDILTKNVDPQQLPAEMDYLADENTLNNYLNSLDASGAGK